MDFYKMPIYSEPYYTKSQYDLEIKRVHFMRSMIHYSFEHFDKFSIKIKPYIKKDYSPILEASNPLELSEAFVECYDIIINQNDKYFTFLSRMFMDLQPLNSLILQYQKTPCKFYYDRIFNLIQPYIPEMRYFLFLCSKLNYEDNKPKDEDNLFL